MPGGHQMIRCFRRSTAALTIALAMLLGAPAAWADRAAYVQKLDLVASTATMTVRHHHDWSKTRKSDGRWHLHYSAESPFGVSEDAAHIAFLTSDGNLQSRVPSPPLTHLAISDDGRFVIGLSRIKLMNYSQLVVYDRKGSLLLKRGISAQVYCLSVDHFKAVRLDHSEAFGELDRFAETAQISYGWLADGVAYLDLRDWPGTPQIADLRAKLAPDRCASPYSPNISESVTNLVRWYHADDPSPRIVDRDGNAYEVRLRDPAGLEIGVRFEQTPLVSVQN